MPLTRYRHSVDCHCPLCAYLFGHVYYHADLDNKYLLNMFNSCVCFSYNKGKRDVLESALESVKFPFIVMTEHMDLQLNNAPLHGGIEKKQAFVELLKIYQKPSQIRRLEHLQNTTQNRMHNS